MAFDSRSPASSAATRGDYVRRIPGLRAFWDFAPPADPASPNAGYTAWTPPTDPHRYLLRPCNLARRYWLEGDEATLADFPTMAQGPFGHAVHFGPARTSSDWPVLLVPREDLHDTPLDIKGPGRSLTLAAWLVHQEGTHAIAGLWHEGTDLRDLEHPPRLIEPGCRQWALFAGLAARPGAVAAHVSDNGLSSFGDRYARHLAVTPQAMAQARPNASPEELAQAWSLAAFTFESATGTVTAYLNGMAEEHWVPDPARHPFYTFHEQAWRRAGRAQSAEQPAPATSPAASSLPYAPPEDQVLAERTEVDNADERVVLRTYEFTQVREVYRKGPAGRRETLLHRELVALKVNPYWFGGDIYAPASVAAGGPFTVGRVIHSRRERLSAWIGGVAVFDQALPGSTLQALHAATLPPIR